MKKSRKLHKCKICHSTTYFLKTHLEKEHNMSLKEYYDTYIEPNTEHICLNENCSNKTTFINMARGYHKFCCSVCSASSKYVRDKMKATSLERYGFEYATQSEEIKEKVISTNLEKFGVEHATQSTIIQDKIKKTNLERYGVEHALQSEEIKDKMKATNLERYGFENPSSSEIIKERRKDTIIERYDTDNVFKLKEIKDKIKKTNLEKYGVENPFQSEEIKDKMKATSLERYGFEYATQSEEIKEKVISTNLERYGVNHHMQLPEYIDKQMKSAYKYKEYIMPSGKVYKIQGYEAFCIDKLLKTYKEDDIVISNEEIPEVWYYMDSKKHRYFGDIYVKSINTMFEVKSEYTYKQNLKMNLLKEQGTIDSGINFEFMIFDKIGNVININDITNSI